MHTELDADTHPKVVQQIHVMTPEQARDLAMAHVGCLDQEWWVTLLVTRTQQLIEPYTLAIDEHCGLYRLVDFEALFARARQVHAAAQISIRYHSHPASVGTIKRPQLFERFQDRAEEEGCPLANHLIVGSRLRVYPFYRPPAGQWWVHGSSGSPIPMRLPLLRDHLISSIAAINCIAASLW